MRRRRTRRARNAVALIVTGSIVATVSSCGLSSQVKESTSRKPATYTELYFTDPVHLPKVLGVATENVVAFSIANHEAASVDYAYVVTAATPETPQGVDVGHGVVAVGRGHIVHESVAFTPARSGVTYLVTVRLAGRAEVIRFRAKS